MLRRVIGVGLAALALAGCSSDPEAVPDLVLLRPAFLLADRVFECGELPDVVTLSLSRGQEFLPDLPCDPFETPLGLPVLVEAFSDDGRLVFSGETDPEVDGVANLAPEASFVETAWTFGELELAPCANEVELVEISVEDGASLAYRERAPCSQGRLLLSRAFEPGAYTVTLRALDFKGLTLYAHSTSRLFGRGLAAYSAVLTPFGGRLLLDWRFQLGEQVFEACDDERGQVRSVGIRVQRLERSSTGELVSDGSVPVEGELDCEAPRPVLFREARFRAGRWVSIQLEAQGEEHAFLGDVRAEMPREGDALVDVGPLAASGTARFEALVSSPECQLNLTSELEVRVEDSEGEILEQWFTGRRSESFVVERLAYGSYRVRLRRSPSIEGCLDAVFARILEAPEGDWGLVEL